MELKRIQNRLMADVEVKRLTAEAAKLREEKDNVLQYAQQFQEELGPLKLELQVSHKDV
jgi:hypothetical protein